MREERSDDRSPVTAQQAKMIIVVVEEILENPLTENK